MQRIAEAAGVSQATVSMALRDHARISRATCRRIQELARAMGYRPDPLVSTLMAQRRGRKAEAGLGTLAVVSLWPEAANSWQNHPFYTPYAKGVRLRAEELGYRVEVFPCDGSTTAVRQLERVLRARGIQGLIFCQAHETFTTLPISVEGFASVLIGSGIRQPRLSRVDAALDVDFHLAWQHLRAAGRTRIALLTWSVLTVKSGGVWVGAYLHLQRALAANDRLPPLELDAFDDLEGIQA